MQNAVFQRFHIAIVCINKFPDQKASHNPHFTWKFICLLNRPSKIQTAVTDGGGGEAREGSFIFRLLAALTKHRNSFRTGVKHSVVLLSCFITED